MQEHDDASPSEITKLVKESFKGLGIKRKRENESKSALSTFAKIMGDNLDNQKDVEVKKLKLDEEKFEYNKELEQKKLEFEMTKVCSTFNMAFRIYSNYFQHYVLCLAYLSILITK